MTAKVDHPLDLSAEVALVTGGGGSIGAGVARRLAGAGAAVVVADVDRKAIDVVVREIEREGGRAVGTRVDVRDAAELDGAVAAAIERFGGLSILVNVAAVLRTGTLGEMSEQDWADVMDVNVTGTFLATRAAAPAIRDGGGGVIVNFSSVAAFTGSTGSSAYTTSKGAVLSFTHATAQELAPWGIRVVAVCPGWVDAGFTDQVLADAEHPDDVRAAAADAHVLGRMATVGDVADTVFYLVSPLASFVTGSAVFVDGGFMIRR